MVSRSRERSVCRAVLASVLLLSGVAAHGAEPGLRAGHGHVSLSYQFISVDGFESSIGELPIGTVETHTLYFDVEYNVTERLTLIAGIPYVRKRYRGPGPHDPLLLDPPRPFIENVDQGNWNSDFQDFHIGAKYRARDDRFVIEPYFFFGIPSHEYPFFGHAAVGQQLLKFDLGTSVTWFPGLSNAFYGADVAYVLVEETLGVSINHWKVNAVAGYQFGPRLTGRVFAQLKDGGGLTFPDDFPTPRNTELWYQHDRLVKHNYLNVGIGLDWALDDTYQVSTNFMQMPWAEQVHKMEYAFTIGISRAF